MEDVPFSRIVAFYMLFTSQETCLNSPNILPKSLGIHLQTDFASGLSYDEGLVTQAGDRMVGAPSLHIGAGHVQYMFIANFIFLMF